jgi:hypothetical protein
MSPLVRARYPSPELTEPVLVIGLDGWVDAGSAQTIAVRALLAAGHPTPVATFETDMLLDYRARRPTVELDAGVPSPLEWPAVELTALSDADGRNALLLHGAEPDYSWRGFITEVVDIALAHDAREVISLGAYPAAVPHTRPARLSGASPSRGRIESLALDAGSIVVPSGVNVAVEEAAAGEGLATMGLYAQVPHYASAMPYPAAAIALLDGLERATGLVFEAPDLATDAAAMNERLTGLLEAEPEHLHLVTRLEEAYDRMVTAAAGGIPTGEELAAELEQFLRDCDEPN